MRLSDRAYTELKQLILSKGFGEEVLSERALAAILKMSRMPVREAVKALENEGLLIVLPRRGIYVRRLSVDQVRELYEVRQAIEGMAAYLCATGKRRAEIGAYRRRLEQQLRRKGKIDLAKIQKESSAFHRAIFELCGNARLLELYRSIEPQIDLNLRLTAVHAPNRVKQALYEHLQIAKAIEAGEGARAERLTRQHLEHGKIARIQLLRHKDPGKRNSGAAPRSRRAR